eukprot:TRINITY_DN1035_c0_g1_i1.p1 TRINITY_DN1035_c0_g1~~TRINITY_DN1035_c0_g1_i1.p1  ORF type:complete len:102 (-),score=4.86 TRINITY_DN1035_c0_g1_i1:78-383(-)
MTHLGKVLRMDKVPSQGTFGFTTHTSGEHELCFEVFGLAGPTDGSVMVNVALWHQPLPNKFVSSSENKTTVVKLFNSERSILNLPTPNFKYVFIYSLGGLV